MTTPNRPGPLEGAWSARPWAARGIRLFVFGAPVLLSVATAWGISAVAPKAQHVGWGIARWIAIAAMSTVVLVIVDKLARRLLPLATLYGLTLAFPDAAPSRYQMVIRKGSTTQLRTRIAEARAGKLGDTPAEAAERVLELVMALSVHDRLTRGHSERVRAYTQMIGEEMGLTARELDRLRWAGLLHDIGKLMVSAEILNKSSKLTVEEFEKIKQHPEFGRKLVAPLVDWLGDAARAVWEHHERWDGNGYPRGLSTTDISLAGRIVSVADAYDVMTSSRSYKRAVSPAAARAELARCSGTQFDPVVVRAFLNLSLGRLRVVTGPLSWLAQLPLLPGAFAASATQATATAATAATAFVGAAAASAGLGLAGQPMLPVSDMVVAESLAIDGTRDASDGWTPPGFGGGDTPATTEAAQLTVGAAGAAGAVVSGSGAGPAAAGDAAGGAAPAAAATTTTVAGDTTTTLADATTTTVVTPGPDTTRPPGISGITGTTTTLAPTGAPTTTVAPPSTTAAPTTTTAAPTTTVPPTTAPRPGWLPAAGTAPALYLQVPGRVDLATVPVMNLGLAAPARRNTRGFDPDRDGLPGLTLLRLDGAAPQPQREATFAFGGPDEFRITGDAGATLHLAAAGSDPVAVQIRAQFLVCGPGGVEASCAMVAAQMLDLVVGADPAPVPLTFGWVDAIVVPQGTFRVVLDVPATSGGDVVLYADTVANPSSVWVTFA